MNRRSLISMSVMTAVGLAVAAGSAAGAPKAKSTKDNS